MAKENQNEDIKPYVLLKDRRPKAKRIKRRLPSGAVVVFKSAFDYKDGDLWNTFGLLQSAEQDVRVIPECFRRMSHDAAANSEAFAEEPDWSDLDTLDILQEVSEILFEAMGTVGESQG